MLELIPALLVFSAPVPPPPDDLWAVVSQKEHDVAIHPKTGEQREIPARGRDALPSPDRSKILYFEKSAGEAGVDVYIADLAPPATPNSQPTRTNARRLLSNVPGFKQFSWTPDGRRVLFLADHPEGPQVYLIATLADPAEGVHRPRQISDATGPCSLPRAAEDGRIAWRILRERKGKETFHDLVITGAPVPGPNAPRQDKPKVNAAPPLPPLPPPPQPPPPAAQPASKPEPLDAMIDPLPVTTFVKHTPLFAFEFSPDASKLAYATTSSLFIHDFPARTTQEIKFSDLDKRLYAHTMHSIAWRPDGNLIAGPVTFLGGRQVNPGEDPYFIFGDKELFFFPLQGDPWWTARPPEARGEVTWISADKLPDAAPLP